MLAAPYKSGNPSTAATATHWLHCLFTESQSKYFASRWRSDEHTHLLEL